MTVPGNIDALLLGGQRGYQIERSLRFNSADSANCSRTFSSSNRKTWTWSAWVKRSAFGTTQALFSAGSISGTYNYHHVQFDTSDRLNLLYYPDATSTTVTTTARYRDPSAWMHIVAVWDTTQSTASNRAILYVNGQQITALDTATYSAQNTDGFINSTVHASGVHYIGRLVPSETQYFSGYLTEVHFVDGQALTPSSFGETDTITGVWKPKKYIHTTSSATSWDYRAYSGTGSPGSWSSMTSVSSGNALGANSSSGTSNPSVAIYSAGAKSKIFRFTGGSGDSRTINVWSSDDGVTWTSQASTTFSVLGSSGHQTTGQYAVYQFANGDFFSSSSYAVTVNDINSFYLKFADNSGTTSTTLGKDSSGNGNNWTPNNFSVTAGAGNDSLIDTPTPYADGGNGRGNYATLNPLAGNTICVLSNGNLNLAATTSDWCRKISTIGVSSGKWYAEFTFTTAGTNTNQVGVVSFVPPVNGSNQNGEETGQSMYNGNNNASLGTIFNDGTRVSTGNTTASSGDVIGVALDASANNVKYYRNGTIVGSSSGYTPTNVSGTWYFVAQSLGSGVIDCNFGQRSFSYTPPAGFLALNTQNLPEPSIKKPSSYMDVLLWTGNGAAGRSITGLNFSPDLVWLKNRSDTYHHQLHDAVRGASAGALYSSLTNAQDPNFPLTSFDSSGFTLGNTASLAAQSQGSQNFNGNGFVAWCWDESATPGFDIVTYTGTGSATTVAHSLGVAPKMIIAKNRTSASSWDVYHIGLTSANYRVQLNSTGAESVSNGSWNGTAPTSTVFSVKDDTATNSSGASHVAYLWSEVAGFSKFGSYTGNGSSDGPFVFCGFRPRWIMIKNATLSGGNWRLFDTARQPYNVGWMDLYANDSTNETAHSTPTTNQVDVLSNGFKLRDSLNETNRNGDTLVFAAFAESPFKYSLAR